MSAEESQQINSGESIFPLQTTSEHTLKQILFEDIISHSAGQLQPSNQINQQVCICITENTADKVFACNGSCLTVVL